MAVADTFVDVAETEPDLADEKVLAGEVRKELRRLQVRQRAEELWAEIEQERAVKVAAEQAQAVRAMAMSPAQLIAAAGEGPDFIIPGVLARGHALMVSAKPKAGKGTFVAYLLAAAESGRSTIFGETGTITTALVYSEEPIDSMAEKLDMFPLKRAGYLFGWNLRPSLFGLAGAARWSALVAMLVDAAVAAGHGILFIDNISRASGVEEEASVELARRIEEVAEACKAVNLTLIIDHHHRKAGGSSFDRARGSDGHVGAVECSLNLIRHSETDELDTRRKLVAHGRLKAYGWSLLVEWDPDTAEYTVIEKTDADATAAGGSEAGTRESRRLARLASLCREQHAATGSEWITADEAAAALNVTLSTAKKWLKDRLAPGRVIAGPDRGRAHTYAVPGWQDADTAMTDNPDAPGF